ncbi:hypothetical protein D3C78_1672550 [compost metagenome]
MWVAGIDSAAGRNQPVGFPCRSKDRPFVGTEAHGLDFACGGAGADPVGQGKAKGGAERGEITPGA